MGSKTGIGIATGIPFINKRKGGSGVQPLPPDLLDALVGVWIADQNNNNSSNRDIIKNKIPNAGGDFELLNFAYKLNSGFGKYEEDFTNWKLASNINLSSDGTKISTISTNFSYQYNYSSIGRDVPSFKVKISNFTEGTISYYYREEDGNEKHINFGPITVTNSNGIVELPKSYNTVENGIGYRGGFIGILNTNIGLTIEQIPSFQGALVTDGVNDLIASTKTMQEMLDGSNEMTVVSMIHQIAPVDKVNNLSYNNYFHNSSPSFIRNNVKNIGKTGIYGYKYATSNTSTVTNILGDKNDYSNTVTNEKPFTSRFFVEGWALDNGTIAEVSQVAWYWTFIAKRALTTDEINQVIAYYNLDKYVKPDIYYDVKKQGLTNDTPDSDWYLKDFSDNGRDMQLYNYGKTPESGINEEGGLQSDGITDYGKAENLPIYKDYTVVADREIVDGLINNADGGVATRGTKWDTGAFCFDYTDGVYSFGATNGYVDRVKPNRFISYMSKYIHNGITTPVGDAVDNNPLCIAKLGSSIDRYSKLALWSFLLFPYSLSEFLLERQLKRYKLGTLYPDMVEFRPIITGNVQYKSVEIH